VGPAPRRAVPKRTSPLVIAVLCLAALLAGCTVGPSQRPPVAVRGENLPPPPASAPATPDNELPEPQPQRANLDFQECTDDVLQTFTTPPGRPLAIECAELNVPVDLSQPSLGSETLDVLRVGARGAPLDRPPLLVFGDTAGDAAARTAVTMADHVSPELLDRYTLVGMDRRGAGASVLNCTATDNRDRIIGADPTETTEEDMSALLEQARLLIQECRTVLDTDLASYRTAAAAQDIELLRAALGVDRLSAIGIGDGAGALDAWARASPKAVGRLVLDGPPQPGLDEPDLTETRAKSAEAAFNAFGVACMARANCPLAPDPRQAVAGLLQRLQTRPLSDQGRVLSTGSAATALLAGLSEPRDWVGLADALAAAANEQPKALLDRLDLIAGPRGRFDGMLATTCNDTQRRIAPGEISKLAEKWRGDYPLFGGTLAVRLAACAPWPTGGPSPAAGRADGAPPILVIGSAADPRSSLEGARRDAESLATASFLSWLGAGTGAYPRTPCVTTAVDAMLLRGTVPQSGTLCPP
jgi:pimeloyl-ACP methyl ester carboxylesterase